MKINYSLFLLAVISFFIAPSCTNDVLPEIPTVTFENSNLEVMVQVETDTDLANAIGAQIFLFNSKEDRMGDGKAAYEGLTNTEGKYLFTALANPEYWITVKLPFDGRMQLFGEDTPWKTPGHPIGINKLEVVF